MTLTYMLQVKLNLAIRNGLIRNKLVSRNHFLRSICHLLHKDMELLALRNNFRATKMFLIAKFDCTSKKGRRGSNSPCCGWTSWCCCCISIQALTLHTILCVDIDSTAVSSIIVALYVICYIITISITNPSSIGAIRIIRIACRNCKTYYR